jgi:hypothetical protein
MSWSGEENAVARPPRCIVSDVALDQWLAELVWNDMPLVTVMAKLSGRSSRKGTSWIFRHSQRSSRGAQS